MRVHGVFIPGRHTPSVTQSCPLPVLVQSSLTFAPLAFLSPVCAATTLQIESQKREIAALMRDITQKATDHESEKAALRSAIEADVRAGTGSRETALEARIGDLDATVASLNSQLAALREEKAVLLAQVMLASNHTDLLTRTEGSVCKCVVTACYCCWLLLLVVAVVAFFFRYCCCYYCCCRCSCCYRYCGGLSVHLIVVVLVERLS